MTVSEILASVLAPFPGSLFGPGGKMTTSISRLTYSLLSSTAGREIHSSQCPGTESHWFGLTHMCRWHHPYGRKWRGTKKPLDESESGQWISWLKVQLSENEDHGIWSHHFMGNRWGNSVRLYFSGLQITADGDCSHEIKRCLLLGAVGFREQHSKVKEHSWVMDTHNPRL